MRVRLSDAQVSAIECRHLEDEEEPIGRAWDGGRNLEFEVEEREELWRALVDAGNAEDAQAQQSTGETRAMANRASHSLAAVAGKVLRSV